MNADELAILPAPTLDLSPPSSTKWERERQAFRRLLPHLLPTHRNQYVAVHDGQVVDSGDDPLTVALRVLGRIGNVDIFVGLVTEEPEPIGHSGIVRNLG